MIQKYCIDCNSTNINKNGSNPNGQQRFICKDCGSQKYPKFFQDDKKVGKCNWREWLPHLDDRRKLREKLSNTQKKDFKIIKTDDDFIIFQPMSDLHIGSGGVEYNRFVEFTDQVILGVENLFFAICGDAADNFVNFKNMLAIFQQVANPEEQEAILDDWCQEVLHKFLFATWGNHEDIEERYTGRNAIKKLLSKFTTYFNGIGICDIKVNDINYRIVANHKQRNFTDLNRCHGLKRMAREQIQDGDIYLAGHTHYPNYERSLIGNRWVHCAVLGTLKIHDGFAEKYFNYWSSSQMETFVLGAKEKKIVHFECLDDALRYVNK